MSTATATRSRTTESREEQARREVGETAIAPHLAWVLAGVFLATLVAVPLAQLAHELGAPRAGGATSRLPPSLDILRAPAAGAAAAAAAPAGASIADRLLAANRALAGAVEAYEDALGRGSIVAARVRPAVQALLAGALGAGNEKAYLGRDGWLFYRPDVEHVTAGGFIEPARLARRAAEARGGAQDAAVHSDPRPAIADFARQLARRGISLVVVPVPSKAEIYPDRFSPAIGPEAAPLRNPSFAAFARGLEAGGVTVLDLATELAAARHVWPRPVFLPTDTHWSPEAVQLAARRIAETVSTRVGIGPAPRPAWRRHVRRVSNTGDVAAMLDLVEPERLFPRESVKIQRVVDPGGKTAALAAGSEILVLGDSFANIYSLAALGWGDGAGLCEQLAFEVGRPVDAILRNDQGASATREMLARELKQGRDRLAGKRVVVWVFAARELSFGDWRPIDLGIGAPARPAEPPPSPVAAAAAHPGRFMTLSPGQSRLVRGRIGAVARVPRPGSVPYRDHIVAVHLVDVRPADGAAAAAGGARPEAIVYMWGMRDNTWTAAADLRPGHELTVTLRPWDDVAAELERINRSELEDAALALEPAAWGEPAREQTL